MYRWVELVALASLYGSNSFPPWPIQWNLKPGEVADGVNIQQVTLITFTNKNNYLACISPTFKDGWVHSKKFSAKEQLCAIYIVKVICRRDKSLLHNKYWLASALNKTGISHLARCVPPSTVKPSTKHSTRKETTVATTQSETTAITLEVLTYPGTDEVAANKTGTTTDAGHLMKSSEAPIIAPSAQRTQRKRNTRFFLILVVLFLAHLVIVFLLGLCLGLLIASSHACKRRGPRRRAFAGKKSTADSTQSDHVDDPFHMVEEPQKKRVFTAVEMERPFKTVEKWTQSGDDDPPLKPEPPPKGLPPPQPPPQPPPKGKETPEHPLPILRSDFDIWDTPLVATQRLSIRQLPLNPPPPAPPHPPPMPPQRQQPPAPSPSMAPPMPLQRQQPPAPSPSMPPPMPPQRQPPLPVRKPSPKPGPGRQIRSVFVNDAVRNESERGRPLDARRSKPKAQISYNLA